MNIVRYSKPGSKWTTNELTAYNITIIDTDEGIFFGDNRLRDMDLTDLPIGMLLPKPEPEHTESYILFNYLELANDIHEAEESAVDDFAVKLLEMLGYLDINHIIRTRKDIHFLMCGDYTHAKTDVCIMTMDKILLLIQEDKSHISLTDPEPQLIAEAIAAFQHNNRIRRTVLRVPEIDTTTFPCITMTGSYPIFYKITVTKNLSDAVSFGTYPTEKTIVQRYQPTARRHRLGMLDLNERISILRCFKAFKQFV